MLRLMVLKTAWLMDTVGDKGAHTEIQTIKIAIPAAVEWIFDNAIQTYGAGGLSQDFFLAEGFAYSHTLRFADGPDEVHKNALARNELKRQRAAREATVPAGVTASGFRTGPPARISNCGAAHRHAERPLAALLAVRRPLGGLLL
ncbi:acyl-CoA dehydrogenase family protein [Glutamicibacter protophormiae]|uniref:acyl-CoA dehydrogenase family protein n=1 Tax=Glutamicibacter protophormiae TaxID=37930 RepID=UPI00198359E4|nr:acyl-CoA dehydrogenase family protein [Glutamicibacter protophormiae]GGL87429.1 hypothetical protein GCM10010038_16850 [Glutamicibacter protophormiae]